MTDDDCKKAVNDFSRLLLEMNLNQARASTMSLFNFFVIVEAAATKRPTNNILTELIDEVIECNEKIGIPGLKALQEATGTHNKP